ncbi:hypothetical protein DWW84_06085 [Bifidobacterium pseudocatenulatum]|nr:hypothetical protein DXD29_00265 [Bifidobacterium pseudocatenulatum]RGU32833.1 hypothetical protein DWW84_06085 [Bifidobacterium pseudocatenulatum]
MPSGGLPEGLLAVLLAVLLADVKAIAAICDYHDCCDCCVRRAPRHDMLRTYTAMQTQIFAQRKYSKHSNADIPTLIGA